MTSRNRQQFRVMHLAGNGPAGAVCCDRRGRVFPDQGGDLPLVVLVDAGRCAPYAVDLPPVRGRRLEQALRWAVEEQLADDASGQHVVPCGRDDAGRMRCLVVEPDCLSEWLAEAGPGVVSMLPDAACLPLVPEELVMLPDGPDVLLRWGEFSFDRVPRDLLADLLPDLLAAAGESSRLVWYGDAPPDFLPADRLELRPAPESTMALLAGGAADNPADLLGGRRRDGDRARLWRYARLAAGLGLGIAVIMMGHAALELHLLKRESGQLQYDITTRLQQVFPEIGQVERPRAQAERELTRLRYGRHAGALSLLARVDPLLTGAGGLRVRSLTYQDGELVVDIRATDVADFDALQARMTALDLHGRVEEVSVGPDSVSGRMRIRERES